MANDPCGCPLETIDCYKKIRKIFLDDGGKGILLEPNTKKIWNQGASGVKEMSGGWQVYDCPRPQLLIPIGQPDGIIRAHPLMRPDQAAALGNVGCYRSYNGKLFLPMPIAWAIRYEGSAALNMYTLDPLAGQLGAAGEMEVDRKNIIVPPAGQPAAVAITNGGEDLAAYDQDQDGIILVNSSATLDVWYRLGTKAAAPAAVGRGMLLSPKGTAVLETKSAINAICDGASANVALTRIYS